MRGVGWVGGIGEELREAYAAKPILKEGKRDVKRANF